MAVGDQVVLRAATLNNESGDERLLVGLVNAEAAGPPATADVLWENGELNTVQQTELLKAFTTPPGDFNVIGKWAQLNNIRGDGAPKGIPASGVVVRALRTGAYDAQNPDSDPHLVIVGEDGRTFTWLGVPADNTFTEQQGRRAV